MLLPMINYSISNSIPLLMLLVDKTKEVVHDSMILPPTVQALPEEVAWQMIYAEGGAVALLLTIAVFVLWKLFIKTVEETRKQNEFLVSSQSLAIQKLTEAVNKVESAVKISDLNNQHSLDKMTDGLNSAIKRLDNIDLRIENHNNSITDHSFRISSLELKITKV